MDLQFRQATRNDAGLILHFIKLMADYEKMTQEVWATEELIDKWIFQEHAAEAMFAVADGREVGFVIYFYNFSTFTGRAGLYVEDVFVLPDYRGRGIGRSIFGYLSEIAARKGCGRMEWVCLDWNTPSLKFYESLGAKPMKQWIIHRLTADRLPLKP